MWGRVKELFRIPKLAGIGAEKAPLPILAANTLGAGGTPTKLKWTVLTDCSIGGKSKGSFEVLSAGDAAEEEEDVGGGAMTKTERRIPLAVFSGQLSTLRPSMDPKVKRTGYSAVKIIMPRALKIENYEGLELSVRTDGRNYVTNLEVDSFFPDELYQGYITGLPAGQWWTIQLPFRDMTLTRLGRLSYIQKELDSTFALESIGFLVADGKPGPFRLEIGGVNAVGKVEGRPLDATVGGGDDGAGSSKADEEMREGMQVEEGVEREAGRRSKGENQGPD
ncbi:nadh:ubiquinone oxidoreductase intermediate-associated protein 30 [Nannochloropsis oceanica]